MLLTFQQILALRLIALTFFSGNVEELFSRLSGVGKYSGNFLSSISLRTAAQYISSKLCEDGKRLVVLWHFDEFHHLPNILDVIQTLGSFMVECQDLPLAISPVFSATARLLFANTINFHFTDIFLVRLMEEEATSIVYKVLEIERKDFNDDSLLDQAIDQLGGIPRFIEIFCRVFTYVFSLMSSATILIKHLH